MADPMDARLSRMGGPAMAPITRTSAQTNEKGGWPSSKRASPPFRQTHLQRWNRSHTTTPLGGRPLLRGARNTHGVTNPNLSNTTPNNLKLVVWRSVLLRILLTITISTQRPTLVNDRSGPYPTWTTKDTPNDILNRLCPWTKEIPQRLARRLLWEPSEDTPEGLNGPTALILYAGADDSYSLKSAMLSISKTWPMSILEVDNKRPHKELSDDMLLGEPYGAFCRGALKGHIRVLGGGPNCRTWSILRRFPKPGAPVPVRDRSPANTWGFSLTKIR